MSHKRKQEEKRRLKKLYEKTKGHYIAGVYYDRDKERLIKYSAKGDAYGYFKKAGNKKVRRCGLESAPHRKSYYKRLGNNLAYYF